MGRPAVGVTTDVLPGAAARATYRTTTDVADRAGGVGSVSWRRVGTRARHLALAFSAYGIGPDCRVEVRLPPSADSVAVQLALACAGATVGIDRRAKGRLFPPSSDPGRSHRRVRVTATGLARPAGTEPLADLVARGAELDAAEPDRFERLVAGLDPDGVLLDERDEDGERLGLDHRAAGAVVCSLDRALGDPPSDRVDRVLVDGGWTTVAERMIAIWWPLLRGASTCVEPGRTFLDRLRAGRPSIVVASGAAWAEVAAALGSDPLVGRGARLERAVLGGGRAAVAGERNGPVARATLALARRVVLPRVRARLGLGSCRHAVAVGPLDEAVRRELLAAGVPLSTAWVPESVASAVTMTAPGRSDRSAGRPLPGWSVAVDDRGRITVDGPATSALRTDRRGRIDDRGRLWLRGGRP